MKKEEYTYLGGLVHGIGTLLTGMKTTMKVYFRKKVTEQYPENRKELKMFDRFVAHLLCRTTNRTNIVALPADYVKMPAPMTR